MSVSGGLDELNRQNTVPNSAFSPKFSTDTTSDSASGQSVRNQLRIVSAKRNFPRGLSMRYVRQTVLPFVVSATGFPSAKRRQSHLTGFAGSRTIRTIVTFVKSNTSSMARPDAPGISRAAKSAADGTGPSGGTRLLRGG